MSRLARPSAPVAALTAVLVVAFAPAAAHGDAGLGAARRALARAGRGEVRARVLVLGDSHVCSDGLSGALRRILQDRFGDGGPGWLPPIWPTGFCGRRGVVLTHGGPWERAGVAPPRKAARPRRRLAPDENADCGLAAFSIESGSPSAFVRLDARVAGELEVSLWAGPAGGTLAATLDGRPALAVDTAAAAPSLRTATLAVGAGTRVELRPAGDGPVRLLGLALDHGTAGVAVDALGVDGARIDAQLRCKDAIVRAELAHRPPDLLVVAYGTNEAISGAPRRGDLEREEDRALERLRRAAPNAACVVAGPADSPVAAAPRVAEVVDVQRRVAARRGCVYWDAIAAQGGAGTTQRWLAATPPLVGPDLVHFTREGYRALAEALARTVLGRP